MCSPVFTLQAQAKNGCPAVDILAVPGTGMANLPGNIGERVGDSSVGEQTNYTVIDYPASAGAMHSVVSSGPGMRTYGDSRLIGVQNTLSHMKARKTQCPNTGFVLYGYSQGADVAGDVAALVGNHKVAGIGPDSIVSVMLVADPSRSGNIAANSHSTNQVSYTGIPKGFRPQASGGYASAGLADGTVGLSGEKSLGYGDVSAKVLSFCNPNDGACSVPKNSALRDIADVSNKHLDAKGGYHTNTTAGLALARNPFLATNLAVMHVLPILFGVPAKDALGSAHRSIQASHITKADEKKVLHAGVDEVEQLFDILHRPELYGRTADNAIVGHVVYNLLTSTDQSHVVPMWLKPHVRGAMQFLFAPLSLGVPKHVQRRVAPEVSQATNTLIAHASYWYNRDGKGFTDSDYVAGLTIRGIDNYINNRPITIPGDPRAPKESPTLPGDGLDRYNGNYQTGARLAHRSYNAADMAKAMKKRHASESEETSTTETTTQIPVLPTGKHTSANTTVKETATEATKVSQTTEPSVTPSPTSAQQSPTATMTVSPTTIIKSLATTPVVSSALASTTAQASPENTNMTSPVETTAPTVPTRSDGSYDAEHLIGDKDFPVPEKPTVEYDKGKNVGGKVSPVTSGKKNDWCYIEGMPMTADCLGDSQDGQKTPAPFGIPRENPTTKVSTTTTEPKAIKTTLPTTTKEVKADVVTTPSTTETTAQEKAGK